MILQNQQLLPLAFISSLFPMAQRKSLQTKTIFSVLLARLTAIFNWISYHIRRNPLRSFFVALVLLLLIIILANALGTPKSSGTQTATAAKQVHVYHIGSLPKISLPAKINKTGVITIVAQSAGIVSSVDVAEGDTINAGTSLIDLSTNYQGGDAGGIQAAIAQQQYNNVADTFGTQLDIIGRQRDVATASAANTNQLQQITQQSIGETNDVISRDQDILTSIDQNLTALQNTNTNGSNDAAMLQTKQMRAQLEAGINQLSQAVRQTQYQTNQSNPPTLLTALQQQITLKQLDVQEKTVKLNKEISRLQVNLAEVTASLMHPASPVNGTVQRIFVNPGQAVSPGMQLAVIQANDPSSSAVVSINRTIAQAISRLQPSTIHIGNKNVSEKPRFVSSEATDGSNYTAIYDIPSDYQADVPNNGFITIDAPVGSTDTNSVIPFVPIDSIYQTEDSAYVYVLKNGKAESRKVTLGNVFGQYVEITNGLTDGNQVITDRNIIAGDKVRE